MKGRPKVLVIDVGGTNVKVYLSGHKEARKVPSSARLTPRKMVAGVKAATRDWEYDGVSIGYPGVIRRGRIAVDPVNLGRGWKGFSFSRAFRRPVKIINDAVMRVLGSYWGGTMLFLGLDTGLGTALVVNDAVMQALGSYRGGTMLFLGLGTGLGTALIVNGHIVPMEFGHFPYRKATIEDYLGTAGYAALGRSRWKKLVDEVVKELVAAFLVDDVVLGGGNVKKLTRLPRGCRPGANSNAFVGGLRLWENEER